LHDVPGSRQVPTDDRDGQHGCPVAPHGLHVFCDKPPSERHPVPKSRHVSPRQQGRSNLPQGLHSPLAVLPMLSQVSSRLAQGPRVVGRPLKQHG